MSNQRRLASPDLQHLHIKIDTPLIPMNKSPKKEKELAEKLIPIKQIFGIQSSLVAQPVGGFKSVSLRHSQSSIFQFEQNDKRKEQPHLMQQRRLLQQLQESKFKKEETQLVIDSNTGSLVHKKLYHQKVPNLFGMKILNSKMKLIDGMGIQSLDIDGTPNHNGGGKAKSRMSISLSSLKLKAPSQLSGSPERDKLSLQEMQISNMIENSNHRRNIILASNLSSQTLMQYSNSKEECPPFVFDLQQAQSILQQNRKNLKAKGDNNSQSLQPSVNAEIALAKQKMMRRRSNFSKTPKTNTLMVEDKGISTLSHFTSIPQLTKPQMMYSPKISLTQYDHIPSKSILYKTESKFQNFNKYTSMMSKSPEQHISTGIPSQRNHMIAHQPTYSSQIPKRNIITARGNSVMQEIEKMRHRNTAFSTVFDKDNFTNILY